MLHDCNNFAQVGPNVLVLGEKARANGLSMSPLERLHSLYDKAKTQIPLSSLTIVAMAAFLCYHQVSIISQLLFVDQRVSLTISLLSPLPLYAQIQS